VSKYISYKKQIAVLLSLPVLVSGCAQFSPYVPDLTTQISQVTTSVFSDAPAEEQELTPAQRQLREQATAFNKTVWEGVVIGAAAGALWGILSHDDTEDILKKTAGGAAVGGLAGWYIASKQREYASREDILDSMIADVRQKNEEAKALIATMQQVVAEDKQKVADLNKQYKQKLVTAEQLNQKLAAVKKDREEITKTLSKANEQLLVYKDAKQDYEKKYTGANTAALGGEITVLQNNINTMNKIGKELSDVTLG
jgi:DNA repair exonuclease SbcCD ATPase subunit